MSNELTISAGLRFLKSDRNASASKGGLQRDVAGSSYVEIPQTVGITEEAIVKGDVTSGGYIYLENLDPTNFITIRQGTGTTGFIQLLPGDIALFRVSPLTSAPYAIADTAPCDLLVVWIDL